MGWKDLLASGGNRVLPWLGGRQVHSLDRTWNIKGKLPKEYGWYTFDTAGTRDCRLIGESDRDPAYEDGHKVLRGFLVGDRFIPNDARVDPDPAKLIDQTEEVWCVDLGLDRFQRAAVIRDREGHLIFMRLEFPEGPELDVLEAYQDRAGSVIDIAGVTPALDLAFRWISYQRAVAEARAAELERMRAAEEAQLAEQERVRRLMEQTGTAIGRRALAVHDFPAAARAALQVTGAELLDVIPTHVPNEVRVQYRYRHRRLECVVNKRTLGIIDAGVCLTDHATGIKGDTLFTLESLPGTVGEAMDLHKLVVWRHAPGDQDQADRWDDNDRDDEEDGW